MRHTLIAAAVGPDGLARLRAADPERYAFLPGCAWAELVRAIQSRPVEMAVVDPCFAGAPRVHEIERLHALFPSLPLLVYTELMPETAAVLLELGRLGIRRAVFHRFDDAPAALRSAIQAELEHSATGQVMHALTSLLDGLPAVLRHALAASLHGPTEQLTVDGLAARAQLTRRTCERWFAKMGLPSPRTVLLIARGLYAHRLLQDPGYTVEDVAAKLGYVRTRTMQMHLKALFGLTAGEMRISLSTQEAVRMVTERHFADVRRAAS